MKYGFIDSGSRIEPDDLAADFPHARDEMALGLAGQRLSIP
jgi:hypothetical protein